MSAKKWVSRSVFYFLIFQLRCTCLAVIILHQHRFCTYKGNRKLKLLIASANSVFFMSDHQVLFCFVNVFGKCGKLFRICFFLERVGRVTVNTAILFFFLVSSVVKVKRYLFISVSDKHSLIRDFSPSIKKF